jgi:hypothetical protein
MFDLKNLKELETDQSGDIRLSQAETQTMTSTLPLPPAGLVRWDHRGKMRSLFFSRSVCDLNASQREVGCVKIEQTSQGTPNSWPHLLSSQAPANSNTTALPVGPEIGSRQDASKEDMAMSGSSASKLGTSKQMEMDGDGHCSIWSFPKWGTPKSSSRHR